MARRRWVSLVILLVRCCAPVKSADVAFIAGDNKFQLEPELYASVEDPPSCELPEYLPELPKIPPDHLLK